MLSALRCKFESVKKCESGWSKVQYICDAMSVHACVCACVCISVCVHVCACVRSHFLTKLGVHL